MRSAPVRAERTLRIIAGQWRGRKFRFPPLDIRPTPDRVRETLFNWLQSRIEGARCLDLFAGSGALGLEALSRGAAHASFLEHDRAALAVLRANAEACRAGDRARVLAADATFPPPGRPCTLLFLDPPYRQGLVGTALAALGRAGWIAAGALAVAETAREEELAVRGAMLAERAHGAARLTVWRLG